MRLKYLLLYTSLLWGITVSAFADIKISIKNIAQKQILLLYNDINHQAKRYDLTLIDGKVSIPIDDQIADFTKVTVVIKGFTKKATTGYIPQTVACFYASRHSNIKLKIMGTSNRTLTYTIIDNLHNSINKDLMRFNEKYNELTKNFQLLTMKIQNMRDLVIQKERGVKKAIIAANKSLKKDSNYIKLLKERNKTNDGTNLKYDYINSHNNLLSSSFLWEMYSNRSIKKDSIVKILVNGYSENVQKEIYCKYIINRLEQRSNVLEGKIFEDIVGISLDGKELKISQFIGKKYIILDFWGTWCGPCKKGMPHMKDFYEKNKDQIELISICCNDKEENWKNFMSTHEEYNWIHLFDKDGSILKQYAIDGFPTKIIINKAGKIVYRKLGERTSDYGEMKGKIRN